MMDIVIQDTCAMPLNYTSTYRAAELFEWDYDRVNRSCRTCSLVLNKIISSHFLGGQYSYLTILSSSDIVCGLINKACSKLNLKKGLTQSPARGQIQTYSRSDSPFIVFKKKKFQRILTSFTSDHDVLILVLVAQSRQRPHPSKVLLPYQSYSY